MMRLIGLILIFAVASTQGQYPLLESNVTSSTIVNATSSVDGQVFLTDADVEVAATTTSDGQTLKADADIEVDVVTSEGGQAVEAEGTGEVSVTTPLGVDEIEATNDVVIDVTNVIDNQEIDVEADVELDVVASAGEGTVQASTNVIVGVDVNTISLNVKTCRVLQPQNVTFTGVNSLPVVFASATPQIVGIDSMCFTKILLPDDQMSFQKSTTVVYGDGYTKIETSIIRQLRPGVYIQSSPQCTYLTIIFAEVVNKSISCDVSLAYRTVLHGECPETYDVYGMSFTSKPVPEACWSQIRNALVNNGFPAQGYWTFPMSLPSQCVYPQTPGLRRIYPHYLAPYRVFSYQTPTCRRTIL